MKHLFITFLLLAGTAFLHGQADLRTPAARAAYLESLHTTAEPDEDTLTTIYAAYQAEKDTAGMVAALGWKAYARFESDIEQAVSLSRQCLSLANKMGLPPSDPSLASAYAIIGATTWELDSADYFLRQAVLVLEEDSYLSFLFRGLLAGQLIYGCNPEVEGVFDRMEVWIETQPEKNRERLRVLELGEQKAYYLYSCAGNSEQAENIYRSQYDLYQRDGAEMQSSPLLIVAAGNLASMNAELGRYAVAEQMLDEIEKVDLKDPAVASALNIDLIINMYQAAHLMGDYPRARKNLETQISLFREQNTLNQPGALGTAHFCLYLVCRALGDYPAARTNLLQAKDYQRDNPLNYAKEIGELLYGTGDYEAAVDTITHRLRLHCLDCSPEQLPRAGNKITDEFQQSRIVGLMYESLMKAKYRLALAAPAGQRVALLKDALSHKESMLSFHQRDLEQEGAQEEAYLLSNVFLAKGNTLIAELNAKLIELSADGSHHAELFENLENAKANDLKKILAGRPLPDGKEQEEATIARRLRASEVARALATEEEAPRLSAEYLAVSEEYSAFWQDLWEQYPEELRQLFALRSASLQQVKDALPPQAVFLQYSTTDMLEDKAIVIQLISRKQTLVRRVPVEIDLSATIGEFRQLIRSPLQLQRTKRERFTALSHQLYQLLIEPVSAFLPAGAPLMICADNDLHFVPFEVLIAEGADKPYAELPFLLKSHPINYHYSATTYVNSREKAPASTGVAVFAPVFDNGSKPMLSRSTMRSVNSEAPQAFGTDGGVAPLPATRAEVDGISQTYSDQKVKILLDKAANKEALRSMLGSQNAIVHIATHGFINEDNHDLSALACYGEQGADVELLYANEIKNEKVKADLIVLSSCESGVGRKIEGEGLIALNRAFIYAGARNVISTLWKIDDRYSSDFMIKFHREAASGQSYTKALRRAKLDFLKNPATAQPRFWAPFVLIGE